MAGKRHHVTSACQLRSGERPSSNISSSPLFLATRVNRRCLPYCACRGGGAKTGTDEIDTRRYRNGHQMAHLLPSLARDLGREVENSPSRASKREVPKSRIFPRYIASQSRGVCHSSEVEDGQNGAGSR